MKKINIINLVLLCTMMVLVGCVKKSDLEIYSKVDFYDDTPFETQIRIEHQVRGIYAALRSGQLYGGRIHIYNDVRADNFISNDGNRVTARAAWEFSENAGDNEVNNLWSAAYTVINRANILIDGVERIGRSVINNDNIANGYIAEAKFLRALTYHALLQFYAKPYPDGNGNNPGLPLRLTPIQEYGQNDLALSTVAQIYTQILDDLNFAEQNLPLTQTASAAEATLMQTVRAHKNTAIALKVRVLMSMNRYDEVVTEAAKIVSNASPFKSTSGVIHEIVSDLSNLFSTPVNPETIFTMNFNTLETPGTQNQLGFYYLPAGYLQANGIFFLNENGIIGNPGFAADDLRRQFIMERSSKKWLAKFGKGSPFIDWIPVLRYAEVLLSYSEAITRSTQTVDAKAVALLNEIRKRAGVEEYEVSDFATPEELIDALLLERNIEFLGEGIRSIDIQRLLQPYPAKSHPDVASIDAVPHTSNLYIWPLPSNETRYNQALQ